MDKIKFYKTLQENFSFLNETYEERGVYGAKMLSFYKWSILKDTEFIGEAHENVIEIFMSWKFIRKK